MFNQTFEFRDLATILILVVLEGALSIDNAMVLGMLAGRLSPAMRLRALLYGLIGSFIFRLIAVGLAAYLLKWSIIKLLGGIYLVYIAAEYFLGRKHKRRIALHDKATTEHAFWPTVLAIELTDVAFAIDSILAAVALVGGPPAGSSPGAIHPKLWVILTGGMLGVVLMRFAAAIFIKLLERFPRLNRSAYLLVSLIGAKMIVDYLVNTSRHPAAIDFQDTAHWPFWIFWAGMILCLGTGFVGVRGKKSL